MPARDTTGPLGFGPMTGRGFGPCGPGRRMGGRCQRGLGRYFGWNAYQSKAEQMKDYEAYRQALQEELEDTETALTSLKESK